MHHIRTAVVAGAAACLLAACGTDSSREEAAAPQYQPLTAADVSVALQITEQQFFVVWNVAWTAEPTIAEDVALEPGTEWVVTYEITAPEVPAFIGETHSFTVEIGPDGEPWIDSIPLTVDEHPVGTHPENLAAEIAHVTQK